MDRAGDPGTRRCGRRAQALAPAFVVALLSGVLLSVLLLPGAAATQGSPRRIDAVSASGWMDSENILGTGQASYAYTTSSGATIDVGFASVAARGPISAVSIKVDQQQVSHSNDQLELTATATGCSTVLADPHTLAPTATRATLSANLECEEGWTWPRVASVAASLQASAVGANILSNGVDGQWRIYRVHLEVTYTDSPPWADAGPDQTVSGGDVVQLSGVATDPENLPLTTAWTQLAGPTVTLATPGLPTTTFLAPNAATGTTLTFRFTATDADGQVATDAVSILLQTINRAPVAEAGQDQTAWAGEAVELLGIATDADGDPLTYQWTQSAGTPVTLQGAESSSARFTAPSTPGVLVFSLRATDPKGLSSPADRVTVTVALRAHNVTTGSTTTTDATSSGTTTGLSPNGTAPPVGPPAPGAPCSQSVAFDAEGRATMRFQAACGLTAASMPALSNVANASVLSLRTIPLAALPQTVPAPPTAATSFVDVTLVAPDGSARQPASIDIRLPVPVTWIDEHCPAPECRIVVWHWHDGKWSMLPAIERGRNGDVVEYEAHSDSLSLFAIGAMRSPTTPVAGPGYSLLLWGALASILVAGTGTSAWAIVRRRRRKSRPAFAGPRQELVTQPSNTGGSPGVARQRLADAEATGPEAQEAPTSATQAKVSRLIREIQSNEALVQFVNNAAHDLANPLSPIQLQLHMLMKSAEAKQDEKGAKSLAIVQRNVEQLGMLVGDLKDAARLQAGKLRLTLGDVDLAQLAAEAAESYAHQAAAAEVALKLDTGTPLPVRADKGRLTQVVTNLVGNALKFTPKGGTVTLIATREGPHALLMVRDTGLGLTEADRERLFRPFSQVHGEAQKAKGTGLGLYISKGIVQAHGGDIGCQSDGPGTGSTFWFSIPFAPVADA